MYIFWFVLVRPLSVRLLQKPRTMVADTEYVITCEVAGSRPKAHITWHRDSRRFRRGKVRLIISDARIMGTGLR